MIQQSHSWAYNGTILSVVILAEYLIIATLLTKETVT